MKLKEYTPENCGFSRKSSPAFVSINTKVGTISFSKEAVQMIELKDGDQVKFHQDESEESEWYVEKVKTGGFIVRTVKSAQSLMLNNSAVARNIAESVAFKGITGRCLMAGQPTEFKGRTLFGLLTSMLNNNRD